MSAIWYIVQLAFRWASKELRQTDSLWNVVLAISSEWVVSSATLLSLQNQETYSNLIYDALTGSACIYLCFHKRSKLVVTNVMQLFQQTHSATRYNGRAETTVDMLYCICAANLQDHFLQACTKTAPLGVHPFVIVLQFCSVYTVPVGRPHALHAVHSQS